MGSIKGLNTFITKTEKQKAQIKQKASTFVRGKVLLVLKAGRINGMVLNQICKIELLMKAIILMVKT